MSRFKKLYNDMVDGAKSGFLAGASLGLPLSLFSVKEDSNRFLKELRQPQLGEQRSFAYTMGITSVIGGAIGVIAGLLKGVFGKLPEEEKGPEAAQQTPSSSAEVPHHAREQQEPLRAPDVLRQTSHAQGMKDHDSHTQAQAARPKEEALSR